MRLWILRPGPDQSAWEPWFDKAFGFVVRAESEKAARAMAAKEHGDEGAEAWCSNQSSTCEPLIIEGAAGVIMEDYAHA